MTLKQNVTLKFRNLKVVVKNEIFSIAFYCFFFVFIVSLF